MPTIYVYDHLAKKHDDLRKHVLHLHIFVNQWHLYSFTKTVATYECLCKSPRQTIIFINSQAAKTLAVHLGKSVVY